MINLAVNVDLLGGLLAGASCISYRACGPLTVYIQLMIIPLFFFLSNERKRETKRSTGYCSSLSSSPCGILLLRVNKKHRMKYHTLCIQDHLSLRYSLMDCVVYNIGFTNHGWLKMFSVAGESGKKGKINEECQATALSYLKPFWFIYCPLN